MELQPKKCTDAIFKINANDIDFAADRNPLKWNRKMPGTNIPIISEKTSRLKILIIIWYYLGILKLNLRKERKNF